MSLVPQSAFLALATLQVDRLVQFYQAILAQPAQAHLPGRYAEFELPRLKLAIFKPAAEQQVLFEGGPGGLSLCLQVADLAGAIAHLAELGYGPTGPVLQPAHGQEIYAYDPDGNRLILYQPA